MIFVVNDNKTKVMSNLLLSYLNSRMSEPDELKKKADSVAGPVITISREVGCNGVKLANLVVSKLNLKNPTTDWKVISKEVFYQSAKELKMHPDEVRKTLHQTEKFTFDDILKAFSDKNYKTDITIIKTMKRVIRQIATEGHCIIIGRAGHIIASNIKAALHIRLIAPLEYRIVTIMHNNHLTRKEAIDFIEKVEKERLAFRRSIFKDDPAHEIFDITINRAAFSDEEIIEIIEYIGIQKNLFEE
jgi:cytidylate kinase